MKPEPEPSPPAAVDAPDDAAPAAASEAEGAADAVVAGGEGAEAENIVQSAEGMADRAISMINQEVRLPSVREGASKVKGFFGSIHSRYLLFVVLFFVLSAVVGVGVTLLGGLPDWYMHAAMYAVVFSFMVLYVKANLMQRKVARGFFALVSLAMMTFFAWVLFDLVAPRLIFSGGAVVDRPSMAGFAIAGSMVAVDAVALLLHWLVLTRYADREAAAAADEQPA